MLSSRKIKELRTAFSYFDSNGDGSITVEELKTAVEKVDLAIDSDQLHEMIHSIDKNKDGKIEFEEFVHELSKKYQPKHHSKSELESAFKYFDKDGSGYINEDELYEVMKKFNPHITKQTVKAILKKIDSDGNGRIYIDGKQTILAFLLDNGHLTPDLFVL